MKRLLDIGIVLLTAPLWLPLLAVTYVVVRRKLGRPALFRQVRPGFHGAPFELVKFRSMTDSRDHDGRLLPDEQRLTPFGESLRASSLDELPELFNVLKGEMSLVGPRPLLPQYLPLYNPRQARRHEVLPGITGWAQVRGRNAVTWDEKLEMDVWYVEHRSLWLDCKILVLTLATLFRPRGINAPGSATAPYFTGSNSSEA